jgi:predicted transcriptional regulator
MNPWASHPSKRRDRLYIIAEILEIAKNGALKTQVMYRSRLSFTQINDYLGFMLEINLMKKVKQNDKNIYKTTWKGLDFLQRYRNLAELIKTEEENSKTNSKMLPSHLLRNVNSIVYITKITK